MIFNKNNFKSLIKECIIEETINNPGNSQDPELVEFAKYFLKKFRNNGSFKLKRWETYKNNQYVILKLYFKLLSISDISQLLKNANQYVADMRIYPVDYFICVDLTFFNEITKLRK